MVIENKGMNVFCKNCKWFSPAKYVTDGLATHETISSYILSDHRKCTYKNNTLQMNNDLACPYYKAKWWKLWIKK